MSRRYEGLRSHSRPRLHELNRDALNRWARPYDFAHPQAPGRLLLNRELAATVIPVDLTNLPPWLARDDNNTGKPPETVVEAWFLTMVDAITGRAGQMCQPEAIRSATRAAGKVDAAAMRELFLVEGAPGVQRVLEIVLPRRRGAGAG